MTTRKEYAITFPVLAYAMLATVALFAALLVMMGVFSHSVMKDAQAQQVIISSQTRDVFALESQLMECREALATTHGRVRSFESVFVGAHSAAVKMAIDEYILQSAEAEKTPTVEGFRKWANNGRRR